jgi:hypothetical protein
MYEQTTHSSLTAHSGAATKVLRLKPLSIMVRLALSGALLSVAAQVAAQPAANTAADTPEIQEVVVTGSNIRRAENDGTVPVSVIG